MDWIKVSQSLLEAARDCQDEQLKTPATKIAQTAALGCAAIVLARLSQALSKGLQEEK